MQNFFILFWTHCPRLAESFSILDVNLFKNEFILFVITMNFSQTMITFFSAPFPSKIRQGESIYYVKVFWGILEPPTLLCRDIFIIYVRQWCEVHVIRCVLKVSKSQKQISKFLFEPKTELKYFCNSALAFYNGSNQKTNGNYYIRW